MTMSKDTREIGNVFRLTEFHPGLPETIVWLEVVESDGCDGCYLKGMCLNQTRMAELAGFCSSTFRKDRRNVIFRKRIEK